MKLRSGKILPPPLCKKCKKFYGQSIWNWKCSYCKQGKESLFGLFHTQEFQEKLQRWVTPQIADEEHLRVLKWSTNYCYQQEGTHEVMVLVLAKLKEDNKYITAEFGEKLLRNCGSESIKNLI